MSRTESPLGRVINRRDFLRGAAALAGAYALECPAATGRRKASPETDYSPVVAEIKRTLPAAMSQRDIVGASVALVADGEVVWSAGFGHTDRSRKVEVTADTLFHAGSVSKSFTALGVLKAAGEGLLALDDPVKKHLPWFAVNSRFGAGEAWKITLRHLLSHHSGLGTWSPLGNPTDTQYHARTFDEVVRSTTASWLKSPPGERFEYSNQGVNLAGRALEEASGAPLADFMRAELLAPLGMTASTFDQREATRKVACAAGHSGKRAVPIVNGVVHPLVAAGGLFTSANDLAQFLIFHLRGGAGSGEQILPQKLLREMYAPQFTAAGRPGGYGLGVYRAIQHDAVRLSHGGLGYGISAHYRLLPEHRLGVVLLTNQDAAHNAPELAGRVVEWMLAAKLGALPKNRPPGPAGKAGASPGEAALRRFEGTYLLYEGMLFRFRYERGALFHVAGGDKLKLEAVSANEFAAGTRRYKFLPGENGRPRGVQVTDPYYDPHAAENSVLYLPVNDTPADARGPKKPEWSRLVGRYAGTFIGGGAEIEISAENGHLYLNGELKLTETGPDLFITADGEAVIFKDGQLSVGNKLYFRRK